MYIYIHQYIAHAATPSDRALARVNPTLMQYYCMTIAWLLRNIRPPPPTHRLYAIHHAILAMAISVQGVTAASSGTHTHAGAESRRLTWRCLARPSAGRGGYRRGAAEILAGSP